MNAVALFFSAMKAVQRGHYSGCQLSSIPALDVRVYTRDQRVSPYSLQCLKDGPFLAHRWGRQKLEGKQAIHTCKQPSC